MINEKSLVIYKNHPAIVTAKEGGKYNISTLKDSHKVRDKDIEMIHGGPCSKADLELKEISCNPRETWELLSGSDEPVSLKELTELLYGEYSPKTSLAAWERLTEGLYFSGDINAIKAKPADEVAAFENKLNEKSREAAEREAFLEKMKKITGSELTGETALTESDRRFLGDVEALARSLTDKSRTMKDLGKSENPIEAHRLLIASSYWTLWENPHPYRFGLNLSSAKIVPSPASVEQRVDLSHLKAYAIDNAWSNDPDDAISLEGPDEKGRFCLWVHVSDPAASVYPDDPADLEARKRGATLYLPEGSFRMLAPELLSRYALDPGPNDSPVPAMSFKILLDKNLTIADISIVLSKVRITRQSYKEADALSNSDLSALFNLSERNQERRLNSGAVVMEMPEVHIHADSENNKITIDQIFPYRSADMVRECMLLAGEAAALWALKNRIPFPYISQDEGDLPAHWSEGLAGSWQLRRCMRPRNVSVKPGVHWGLGMDQYTQVTSPLRRYTDLLCHQQIRAFLSGRPLITEDDLGSRLAMAETAAAACTKAERASRLHWLAVYLSDKKDSLWKGIVLDGKSSRASVIIPALGFETQINLRGKAEANEEVELILLSSKIPESEIIFALR